MDSIRVFFEGQQSEADDRLQSTQGYRPKMIGRDSDDKTSVQNELCDRGGERRGVCGRLEGERQVLYKD